MYNRTGNVTSHSDTPGLVKTFHLTGHYSNILLTVVIYVKLIIADLVIVL